MFQMQITLVKILIKNFHITLIFHLSYINPMYINILWLPRDQKFSSAFIGQSAIKRPHRGEQ